MRFRHFLSLFILCAMSLHANQLILDSADMDVSNARFGFENIEKAQLLLVSDNGQDATGIYLFYNDESVELAINDRQVDDCGAVIYTASLPKQNPMGARYSVVLTDYSHSTCNEEHSAWVAYVRKGYGFCGTFDATMTLSGLPKSR